MFFLSLTFKGSLLSRRCQVQNVYNPQKPTVQWPLSTARQGSCSIRKKTRVRRATAFLPHGDLGALSLQLKQCPQSAWLLQSLFSNQLQCKQETELTADVLQMAAYPSQGTAVTSHSPTDPATSLALSTQALQMLFWRQGRCPGFPPRDIQHGATVVPQQLGLWNCSQGILLGNWRYFQAPPAFSCGRAVSPALRAYKITVLAGKNETRALNSELLKLLRKKRAREGGNHVVSIPGKEWHKNKMGEKVRLPFLYHPADGTSGS